MEKQQPRNNEILLGAGLGFLAGILAIIIANVTLDHGATTLGYQLATEICHSSFDCLHNVIRLAPTIPVATTIIGAGIGELHSSRRS